MARKSKPRRNNPPGTETLKEFRQRQLEKATATCKGCDWGLNRSGKPGCMFPRCVIGTRGFKGK